MGALGKLGQHAAAGIDVMAALLADGDEDVRETAVGALGNLGQHAAPHASAMAALLADGDERGRRAAVEEVELRYQEEVKQERNRVHDLQVS